MMVNVEGQLDTVVPELLGDIVDAIPLGNPQGRIAVPQIVNANPPQTRFLKNLPEDSRPQEIPVN